MFKEYTEKDNDNAKIYVLEIELIYNSDDVDASKEYIEDKKNNNIFIDFEYTSDKFIFKSKDENNLIEIKELFNY